MEDKLFMHNKDAYEKLCISNTSYQEIKNRLHYKGAISVSQYKVIEKIVKEIDRRFGKVTVSTIIYYWNECRYD